MNVLVLNMGMQSIRSIIFDGNGRKLSSVSRTLISAINEIRVEQYLDEWWEKAVEVMKAFDVLSVLRNYAILFETGP